LQGSEAEQSEQEREPELDAAEADEPAENVDTGAGDDCCR
jgi:hypothetical protein